jgi:ketosteroid isomerase-like protein
MMVSIRREPHHPLRSLARRSRRSRRAAVGRPLGSRAPPVSPRVQLVAGLYAAFARRDLPAIFQTLSPAVVFSQTEELPWGGIFQGLAGAQAFMSRLVQHIDSQATMTDFVEAGSCVVALGRTRGVARATGRAFDVRAVHVWTLGDPAGGIDRITRLEAYIDTPAMLDALAGGPPAARLS